jgi:hypothetical protein
LTDRDLTIKAEITHHQAQTVRTLIEAFSQISGDRVPLQAIVEAVVKNDLTLIFNKQFYIETKVGNPPNQEGTNA